MFSFTRYPRWYCCWCLGLLRWGWLAGKGGGFQFRVTVSLDSCLWYCHAYQEVTVLRSASPLLKKVQDVAIPRGMGFHPTFRLSLVTNLGINLITFCLTKNTPTATLEWSAKPLYCMSISLTQHTMVAFFQIWLATESWKLVLLLQIISLHNQFYTFSWIKACMNIAFAWWGWGLFHLWESSKHNRPKSAVCLNDDKSVTVLTAVK